jgi:hypothetical protein
LRDQKYLFQHQLTGAVKAYKRMTPEQAEAANLKLFRETHLCCWVLEPLAVCPPEAADLDRTAA